ncbi:Clan SC, family S9, unassigned serine peptidase [Histomonas meleagridis]|uniref:Clan SC, family S9, unassigned serine peptidase n=1 Tax=Histomonas meleagridis TaxID=135588 RepID=UPI0035599380|nr:Clan SC, family S9, unassigned serine peptidase [Histomonas meleagridis]KAH0801106.1 Clan SC, family S9, unassigned serine peptidase [Histomonas meleagridis]
MKGVVQWIADVALRPARASYDVNNTVTVVQSAENHVYRRIPVTFKNSKSLTLYGSLWHDIDNETPTVCMIFLHSLGNNQFEALNLIPFLCTPDLAMFCFDFTGSGNSEGDFIPILCHGFEDVLAASNFIRSEFHITKIGLWGRSLGAAIGLNTVSASNNFFCFISDSAFSSIYDIVYDHARKYGIPSFFMKFIEPLLIREARNVIGDEVDINYPLRDIPCARVPLLMGHGKSDTFVPLAEGKAIFDKYGCQEKQFYIFCGKHNSPRPRQWYETAARFIYRHAGIRFPVRNYDSELRNSFLHVGDPERIIQAITLI